MPAFFYNFLTKQFHFKSTRKLIFFYFAKNLSHISVKAKDCLTYLLKIPKFKDIKKLLETQKMNKTMMSLNCSGK